jgi:hypothetical protein
MPSKLPVSFRRIELLAPSNKMKSRQTLGLNSKSIARYNSARLLCTSVQRRLVVHGNRPYKCKRSLRMTVFPRGESCSSQVIVEPAEFG